MPFNLQKTSRIIQELNDLFFSSGASRCETAITKHEDGFFVEMESDFSPFERHRIESLEKHFEMERNPGLEEAYWRLLGTGNLGHDSELNLLGQMIESFSMELGEDRARLTFFKSRD